MFAPEYRVLLFFCYRDGFELNADQVGFYSEYFILAKYNSSGILQWQKSVGPGMAANYKNNGGCYVDSSGNSYVYGVFFAGAVNNGILLKYNSSGTAVWG